MKNIFILITAIIIFSSCEKGVVFKLDEAADKLVVEASVETNEAPVVTLTKSFNYFSTITPQQLSQSFVRNADIWISDGVKTHKLIEYTLNFNNYNLYYYSINPNEPATVIRGEEGGKYSLKIIADGKEYNSQTTIPVLTKTLDSIWWVKAPQNEDTNKIVVKAKVTDPPLFGNYIRYFTRVGTQRFLPGENSVFDDQFVNGVTFSFDLDKGVDRNADTPGEEKGFFKRGDTVTVKFCNIDKATYDFWRTMEFNYSSTGNPFSSPNKVLGNISNGALGAFSGYAPMFRTIIIPK
jgi:Domain of unknown function (DUF4249)